MQGGVLKSRYEYDSLNRLIREDNRAKNESYFYSYDNNGNIVSKETCGFTVSEHELGTGTVVTYTYENAKLVAFGTEISEFDAIGNPTLYRGKSATWIRGRKLIDFDGNSFEYDAQGKRIRKNEVSFVYDSQNRLLKQSNGLEFFYDTVGLLGFSYAGNNYYYRKDVQGNIIAILDSAGNIVVQYEYDAWGNHTVSGSNAALGNINPFRYRSYYFDTETNLYFLQTRYYDAEVGRFINVDGIENIDSENVNGLNLFAYCNNNPVMNIDPEGTWSWKGFWRVVAAVAIVVAVTAAAVVTAGVAAAAVGASVGTVMACTAVGGALAGGLEIVRQVNENGAEEINFGSVAIEAFTGSAMGAISGATGTSGSAIVKAVAPMARIGLAGFSATLHGINEHKSFEDTMGDVGYAMAGSLVIQGIGAVIGNYSTGGKLSQFINSDFGRTIMTGLSISARNIWRTNREKFKIIFDRIG